MESTSLNPRRVRHKIKVCGLCGKAERINWNRHWKRADHQEVPHELEPGNEPQKPWRADWIKELPPELKEIFDSSIMV
jgi:predicted alpha/beta hydrolase family esterase